MLRYFLFSVVFLLVFSIALPQTECLAQLKIFDEIGGGGTAPAQNQSNDNSFIYIAGGVAIAAIIFYALVLKKDKNEEEDTTAVNKSLLPLNANASNGSVLDDLIKEKEELPVDFYFRIKNDEPLQSKTYIFGISLKL
jgi:hypothetical protein